MSSPADSPRVHSRAPRVLIIDDEESFHRSISRYLESFRLFHTYTASSGMQAIDDNAIDVVILDLGLPDCTGLEFLAKLRVQAPDIQVIVVTASSEIKTAVAAVKAGAFDFLTKRHENYQALAYHIGRALSHRSWQRERQANAQSKSWHQQAFDLLEGTSSEELRATVRLAQKTAPTPLSILIEGPSGAGKEIMARYVHARSAASDGPLVAVNVAAVPESLMESQLFGHEKGAFTGAISEHVGKFELADGGSIFLDEIGEMAPACQAKLLRVLQEREVERVGGRKPRPINCRVIAATNKDLQEEVLAGRFREDLFYRLNGIRLPLPPLCRRPGDIPDLVSFLAEKSARLMGCPVPRFEPEVLAVLASHHWPGNIRELDNLVMRLVVTSDTGQVVADDVPPEYWLSTLNQKARIHAASLETEKRLYFLAREQFERYLVRYTVHRCGGNKRRAAKQLGVSYSTVKEKSREE